MFVPFLYELRDRGVKVGAQEALSLAQSLGLGLHRGTLDGFYETARALCVHREQDLDAFDRAFAHHFPSLPADAIRPDEDVMELLEHQKSRTQLSRQLHPLLQLMDLRQVRQYPRKKGIKQE